MSVLLLGAIIVAAIPLVVGIIVGEKVPGAGDLRPDGGAWRLLHLLWVYPATFMLAAVSEGVAKHVTGKAAGGIGAVVEAVFLWVALTFMFGVFFEQMGGAAIGAGVALVVYWPFVHLLQRSADRAEAADAPET